MKKPAMGGMQWFVTIVTLFSFLPTPCVVAVYDKENKVETVRVYGNLHEYAYYFVDLLLGTPPQRVSVILDTGSGLCAFPCKNCEHCGRHIDAPFDYGASSTAKWVECGEQCISSKACNHGKCTYRRSYIEGSSIDGLVFEDKVSLGDAIESNPPVRAQMGCHQRETNIFYIQQVNGILGIRGPTSLLQSFFKDSRHVDTDVFTMCLSREGGRLTVGGAVSANDEGELKWMRSSHSVFDVPLQSMEVHGKTMNGSIKTLLDSGTTMTYFPDALYRHLQSGIRSHCQAHGHCGAMKGTCFGGLGDSPDFSRFPIINVNFEGMSIHWNPSEYLYHRPGRDWCFAFENDGNMPVTILGASFMMNKDVVFDLKANRIAMVAATCPEHLSSKRPLPPHGLSWDDVFAAAQQDVDPENVTFGNFTDHDASSFHRLLIVTLVLLAAVCFARCILVVRKLQHVHGPSEGLLQEHEDSEQMAEEPSLTSLKDAQLPLTSSAASSM